MNFAMNFFYNDLTLTVQIKTKEHQDGIRQKNPVDP